MVPASRDWMVNKISSVLAPVGLAFQAESTACPEVAGGWPRGLLVGGVQFLFPFPLLALPQLKQSHFPTRLC